MFYPWFFHATCNQTQYLFLHPPLRVFPALRAIRRNIYVLSPIFFMRYAQSDNIYFLIPDFFSALRAKTHNIYVLTQIFPALRAIRRNIYVLSLIFFGALRNQTQYNICFNPDFVRTTCNQTQYQCPPPLFRRHAQSDTISMFYSSVFFCATRSQIYVLTTGDVTYITWSQNLIHHNIYTAQNTPSKWLGATCFRGGGPEKYSPVIGGPENTVMFVGGAAKFLSYLTISLHAPLLHIKWALPYWRICIPVIVYFSQLCEWFHWPFIIWPLIYSIQLYMFR